MQKWKKLDTTTVTENPYLSLKQVHFQLPNGKEIPDYFIVERGDYILVVAVDMQGRILLERQYRPGVDTFVYEMPAGWIDENESPEQAALRELREETGFSADSVQSLGSFHPLAGFMKETAHVLLLRFDSSKRERSHHDETEEIETQLVTQEELRAMIRRNEVQCMGSLAALNLYWNQQEK